MSEKDGSVGVLKRCERQDGGEAKQDERFHFGKVNKGRENKVVEVIL